MTISGQLPLAGFDERPEKPSDRLFFAIRPDAGAVAHIERLVTSLRDRYALKGSPLGRDRYHVTLHHIGDFDGLPADVIEAASAAARLTLKSPFELTFDRVMSFSTRARTKPLVLLGNTGLAALKDFQRSLGQALIDSGLGRSVEARYTPHLTLLYDQHPLARQEIEPISWTADEFVLVRSLIGHSRHEVLARWPLSL